MDPLNISGSAYGNLSRIVSYLDIEASRALDYESSRLKDGLIIAIILTAFLGELVPLPLANSVRGPPLTGVSCPGLFTVLVAVATYILT